MVCIASYFVEMISPHCLALLRSCLTAVTKGNVTYCWIGTKGYNRASTPINPVEWDNFEGFQKTGNLWEGIHHAHGDSDQGDHALALLRT